MSDDKRGTIEIVREEGPPGADGKPTVRQHATIFPPSAVAMPSAPRPGQSSPKPTEELPSHILLRVIRHINGLAVALEALRTKLAAQETARKE